MPWIIAIIIILITTICLIGALKASEHDREGLSCSLMITGVICGIIAVISVLNALCWTGCIIDLDVCQANVNAQGEAYSKLLNNYEQTLMINDITASESYLDLYEKILDYNSEVRRANKWKNTWGTSGILYDPSYEKAELIPIDAK